jgi:hypothetical protein
VGSGAAPACSASVSKRLADILGGEATDSLAKGESGGHPITGVNRFKRGFPDAHGPHGAGLSLQTPVAPWRAGRFPFMGLSARIENHSLHCQLAGITETDHASQRHS